MKADMSEFPEEWRELAQQYEALGTIEKAAEALDLSYSTARWRLVRMGIEINQKGPSSWRMILTGTECREARIAKSMSQEDLATASGVTVSTISNFETGRRTPRPKTQEKLASALGLNGGKSEDLEENAGK
ncbi:helix-turn-helix domain-containing protein [Sulfitobacter sp. G21635-S1]|nr:helix-turn-helix domain-containing protein [Sulfitobacter sp. G21635-S1]MCZ4258692.1 helix-turn-helix domain-containing protein [Sulfitobacter sp. G21635-S1]